MIPTSFISTNITIKTTLAKKAKNKFVKKHINPPLT